MNPENQYTVRRASAGDITSILSLLVQVNMVHHNGRPDLFKGPATKYGRVELETILKNLDTPVFVCTNDQDEIIGHGFCILQRFGDRLMTERKTLYIDDICVDEKARGLGVGRALYNHILRFAGEEGCYNITLNVWTCNPGAMEFYQKLGLVPFRIGMEHIL